MATIKILTKESLLEDKDNPRMGAWVSDEIDKRPFEFEFTTDPEKIGSAGYVVFADNTAEAALKIRKLINEPTDGVISLVNFHKPSWNYNEETDARSVMVGMAKINDECTEEQIIDYVKKNGSLEPPHAYYSSYTYHDTKFNLYDIETRKLFWDAGIHMDMNKNFLLSYDPQKASRQKRYHLSAQKTASIKNSRLRISDIYSAIYALDVVIDVYEKSNTHGHSLHYTYHVSDQSYTHRMANKKWTPPSHFCRLLLLSVDYFNFYYGKNAHRKIAAFQDIVTRWGKTLEKQKSAFGATFAVWMEEEMKARKYKPVDQKDMKQKGNAVSALVFEKMREIYPKKTKEQQ